MDNNENMMDVTENEVMDQANDLVEYEDEGITGKDVAIFGAGIVVLSAAGYGIYQLGKKGVNWVKKRKAVHDEAKRILAEQAEEEEFDPDEEIEEIHVVK